MRIRETVSVCWRDDPLVRCVGFGWRSWWNRSRGKRRSDKAARTLKENAHVMGLRASAEQLHQTLHTMPARSRLWLLLAIVLTFASLTFWSDASAPTSGFWIAAWAWLSGLIGVAYAVVWLGYQSLLPIAVILNLLGPALLYRWMPPRGEIRPLSVEQAELVQTRLQVLAFVRGVTTCSQAPFSTSSESKGANR